MKNKYVFLGDINSINTELIKKSFNYLKERVRYIIIGDFNQIIKHSKNFDNFPKISLVLNPLDFINLDKNSLNIYNVSPKKLKIDNMISQLRLCNELCNATGYDLITLPINKYIFKKKIKFNGMTEYLSSLNKLKTIMLMKGEVFSIMPITTHINLKNVGKNFNLKISNFFKNLNEIDNSSHILQDYENFFFLCFNPHCGENGTIGNEDIIIKKKSKSFKKKINLLPADSAFKMIKNKSLYISFYHDQALIPFKILNKKSYNHTIGLKYRRLSPSHGTANDIIFKNLADNTSYLKCMTS